MKTDLFTWKLGMHLPFPKDYNPCKSDTQEKIIQESKMFVINMTYIRTIRNGEN